ncbi:hypothetical protein ACFL3Y_01845 [Pseudomonadota bacterium]
MKRELLKLRRLILKALIPEFVWPRAVRVGNVSIKLRGTPYSFGIKRLLKNAPDSYEGPERHFIMDLSEGDQVLEYGGSLGIVTALISERIGPRGRVVSVEADEALTSYSKTWLELRGNVEVVSSFAFPIYRRVPLNVTFDNSGGSLGGMINFEKTGQESEKDYENCFFIIDAEERCSLKPNVLFIDIEGAEKIILEHSPEVPPYVQKIVIELHPTVYGEEIEKRIVCRLLDEGFNMTGHLGSVYHFRRQAI